MVLFGSLKFDTLMLLTGALTLLFLFIKRKFSYWDRKGFKTLPDYYYITGHQKLDFGRKSFADTLTRLYRATSEPFIGVYLMLGPKLLARDPEFIKTILIKDFPYFTDRAFSVDEEKDPLSGNLLALPGPKWKNLRTKLSPTFTSGKLKAMFSTLVECGSTLQNHLNKLAETGELLDVKEISACYATNVIASVAFGIEVDSINDPNNDFRVCGRTVTEVKLKDVIRALFVFNAPKLAAIFGITLNNPSAQKFIMSVVKQNLEYREKNNVVRKDFFQLLIQLRNSGTVQLDDEWETVIKNEDSPKSLTLNEMTAQVFIFFLAGFETSSSTLTFCLYELAKNPDIQQRIQDEIDRVLAKHNGQITYESISEMKYLESCIEETMRMYPVVPALSRVCVQDYQIPGTDKIIEKGVEVVIPAYSLHRDEKYYDEPNKFNPDRFSEENPAGKNQSNQPFLTFGDGPRNCIGMRLGKMQTKVGLMLMLQKNKYELEDRLKHREMELDPQNMFVLAPLGGVNLKVFKR